MLDSESKQVLLNALAGEGLGDKIERLLTGVEVGRFRDTLVLKSGGFCHNVQGFRARQAERDGKLAQFLAAEVYQLESFMRRSIAPPKMGRDVLGLLSYLAGLDLGGAMLRQMRETLEPYKTELNEKLLLISVRGTGERTVALRIDDLKQEAKRGRPDLYIAHTVANLKREKNT